MIPRPASETADEDDASIPVLTDHLEFPPLELDTTLPSLVPPDDPFLLRTTPPLPARREPVLHWPPDAPPSPPKPATRPETPSGAPIDPSPPVAPLDAAVWAQIEGTLRDTILQEIAQRLPQEIETTVRSRTQEAIDRALESLVAEAQLAIASTLHDIIGHAVHASLEQERETLRRAGRSH